MASSDELLQAQQMAAASLEGQRPENAIYSDYAATGVQAEQSVYRFPALNGGTYKPNGARIIRIPLKAVQHLAPQESALFFDCVNLTPVDNIEVQGSAHSFFQRYILRGPHDEIIDDIDDYHVLMAMISHHQIGKEHRQSIGAMLSGYSNIHNVSSVPARAVAYDGTGTAQDIADQLTVRSYPSSSDKTTRIESGARHRFAIPLPGLLSTSKYIPIHKMSGLTIELHLSHFNEAVTSQQNANVLDFRLENFEYLATLISFSQSYESLLSTMLLGGMTLSSPTWRSYRRNVQGGQYTIDVPERARSLKSLFVVQRVNADLNDPDQWVDRTLAHSWAGNSEYQLKVGGMSVPQTPVQVNAVDQNPTYGSAEAYYELMKAFGNSAHEYRIGTSKETDEYLIDRFVNRQNASAPATLAAFQADKMLYTALAKQIPAFCMGVDTESFSRSSVISGVDNKENHLNITFKTTRAIATPNGVEALPLTVNVFTLIDQSVIIMSSHLGGFLEVAS